MPRKASPARLWLRPAANDRAATWIILDHGHHLSTGCSEAARSEAEGKLADYIAAKHNPAPAADDQRPRLPGEVAVADVISIYLDDIVAANPDKDRITPRIDRLLDWWGDKMLAEVTPASCHSYAAYRKKIAMAAATAKAKRKAPQKITGGGARRDLEDLRAAINHHADRQLHVGRIKIALPEKGRARQEFLSRDEAARLLWACWRHKRDERIPRGERKGQVVESDWYDLRHVARFLLMGLYTGSRSGAIFSASPYAGANRSFIDLDSGVFYRLAEGRRQTNKRQPPIRLPGRLLTHLRRWKEKGLISQFVVEWEGLPIQTIKTGLARALQAAGITKRVTPHTLRHTAATWMMLNGVPTLLAANYLGMSEKMLIEVYGHYHPDFQGEAIAGLTQKPKGRVPAVSLPLSLPQKPIVGGGPAATARK